VRQVLAHASHANQTSSSSRLDLHSSGVPSSAPTTTWIGLGILQGTSKQFDLKLPDVLLPALLPVISCEGVPSKIPYSKNPTSTLQPGSAQADTNHTLATMTSLNLSTNGPSITKSYQSVVNSPAPPAAASSTFAQWAVFSVTAPLANAFAQDTNKESVLKVQSTGGWSSHFGVEGLY
jgi:hypothetical protein